VLLRSLQAADASRQLKEANREIREREQILRSILDNTSAVVYLKDLTGKLLMANHQFCNSFLDEGEVAAGKTFYDIFETDTAELLSQYDRRVLETKSSFQVEELLPMNDGPHLYLTSRFVIRDDSGEVTMLGAVSTDITELRTVKSQVDRFFELSNNLLCIANMDGYFVRANEAWERTLGIKLSDLTSRPFTDFIHPDDLEPTQVEYARQAAGQDVISFENRYRCADGSYRTLLWNATPTTLDGLIYASAHDITERKSTELQIAGLNLELSDRAVQLEAVNRELEAFCYSVSHDLRAPLRAIDGFSLALIEDCAGKLAESELGYLKRVRAGAQRMAVLIDDLLRLSRVSRSSLNIEEVDLSKLAETVIERIRERDAGRVVEVTIAPHLSVHGDRQLLSVLLENLLGNAWKFTGKTNQPAIRFDHTIIDGVGRFCVRDNGAGFDMMYVHKLFSAFQRLHTEKEFEGTGIGLATAQRVVRRHGGDIWAESGVSQGAAFYFTLQPSQRHGGNHAEEINPAG
jgi:PAS domain S-box-containing protein